MHLASRAQYAAHMLLSSPPTMKSKDPIAMQLWPERVVVSGGNKAHPVVLVSYISIEASALQQTKRSQMSATVSMHSATHNTECDSLVAAVDPSDYKELCSDRSAGAGSTGCG